MIHLPLRMPERLDVTATAAFADLALDAAVVAGYGLILPPIMLTAPRLGCLNVHASLLPRWRGATPIERALLAGDQETGTTIMQMDVGLDTGPILLQEHIPIGTAATAAELHDRLASLGAGLIVQALDALAAEQITPRPQPTDGATYARKLRREEGRLDWRMDPRTVERTIRALNPTPGVWFEHKGERIKVLTAAFGFTDADAPPGTVLDDELRIACGNGWLAPLLLQRAGRSPTETAAFLRGFKIPVGSVLPF